MSDHLTKNEESSCGRSDPRHLQRGLHQHPTWVDQCREVSTCVCLCFQLLNASISWSLLLLSAAKQSFTGVAVLQLHCMFSFLCCTPFCMDTGNVCVRSSPLFTFLSCLPKTQTFSSVCLCLLCNQFVALFLTLASVPPSVLLVDCLAYSKKATLSTRYLNSWSTDPSTSPFTAGFGYGVFCFCSLTFFHFWMILWSFLKSYKLLVIERQVVWKLTNSARENLFLKFH